MTKDCGDSGVIDFRSSIAGILADPNIMKVI